MKTPAMRPSVAMLLVLGIALLVILLTGCATTSQPATVPANFVVVRHAEKADDGSRDPPLAAAGSARARRLAAALHDDALVAVYATPYQRTQQTAAAIASDRGLAVITYPANQSAAELAAQLRSRHDRGTVVVVGHSNTAPAIAAALCHCDATPLGDNDYGRMYRIRIEAAGSAVLQESSLP